MNCSLIVDFAEILHIKVLQNGCFLNIFAEKLEICMRTEYYIVNQQFSGKRTESAEVDWLCRPIER